MKRHYASTLLVLIVLFLSQVTLAKPPLPVWRSGQLAFWNGASAQGELAYNWSAEMVLLRLPTGQIRTYSASQVRQFGWFDPNQHKQRIFVSLARNHADEQTAHGFYEVCLDGSLTVVRQLKRQRGWLSRSFHRPEQLIDTPELADLQEPFNYFVYDEGQFLTFERFFPDIYHPHMISQSRELDDFVLSHNLNARTILGQLILVDRYNNLSKNGQQTASARTPSPGSE